MVKLEPQPVQSASESPRLERLEAGQTVMASRFTLGLKYEDLRKECLEALRQWPGCETVAGLQIVRSNKPGTFSVRVTLYGNANSKLADRAIKCVEREKRRSFHLVD
jgi:hypothetical protein